MYIFLNSTNCTAIVHKSGLFLALLARWTDKSSMGCRPVPLSLLSSNLASPYKMLLYSLQVLAIKSIFRLSDVPVGVKLFLEAHCLNWKGTHKAEQKVVPGPVLPRTKSNQS